MYTKIKLKTHVSLNHNRIKYGTEILLNGRHSSFSYIKVLHTYINNNHSSINNLKITLKFVLNLTGAHTPLTIHLVLYGDVKEQMLIFHNIFKSIQKDT